MGYRGRSTKLLLQRTDRLGDVVLVLPLIEAIQERFPGVHIHVMTSPIGSELLKHHPLVKKLHTVEEGKGIRYFLKTLNEIYEEEFDVVIHVWNRPIWALLTWLARIPVRIGDATNWPLRLLYTRPIRQTWEDITKHQMEFNMELLKPLGIPMTLKQATIPIPQEARDTMGAILKKYISPAQKIVLIFTGTGGTNEPIPETAVMNFMRLLLAEEEWAIILAGQYRPDSALNDIKDDRILNMMGRTEHLMEVAALIERADIYIGPDTGPTHFASFLQKPMVFFSSMKPNPPLRWGSLSPYQSIIRREYVCPYVCVKKCHPTECFAYVTGELLKTHFDDVVMSLSLQEAKTPQERKQYHAAHTFRSLVITTSEAEYLSAKDAIAGLEHSPLKCFAYHIPKWSAQTLKFAIEKVIQHNINILQGSMPKWVVWIIQIYMGVIVVYTKPRHVPVLLTPGFEETDLLQLYAEPFRAIHGKR